MSLVSPIPLKPTIFFGSISAPQGPPLIFDAAVTDNHPRSSSVSDNPIESSVAGSGNRLISDHIQNDPETTNVQLVVSRYALGNVQPTRHIRIWRRLDAAWKANLVFDYLSSVKLYTGCVFTSVGLPRSSSATHIFYIDCTIRKLEIAGVDAAQQMADSATSIALGVIDGGIQGTAVVAASALLATQLTEDE